MAGLENIKENEERIRSGMFVAMGIGVMALAFYILMPLLDLASSALPPL